MNNLIPLEQSQEYDQIEAELKRLAIDLYQAYLADKAKNINVYGNPYLGNRELIEKSLVSDNMGNFEIKNATVEVLKYLLMARRYRNGKRGLHLLNTYMRGLWSDDYKAYQLYFDTRGTYAQDASLFSMAEIEELKQDIKHYILTSRVRIELDPNTTLADQIPSDVANSLDDTLPARLFVHDIIVKRDVHGGFNVGSYADYFSYTSETVVKFEVERAFYLTSRPYNAETDDAVKSGASMNYVQINSLIVDGGTLETESVESSFTADYAILRDLVIDTSIETESVESSFTADYAILRDVLLANSQPYDAIDSGASMNYVVIRDQLLTNSSPFESLQSGASMNYVIIDTP